MALSRRYGFACDCVRCQGLTHAGTGEDVDFLMEAVIGVHDDAVNGDGDDVGVMLRESEAMLARAEQVAEKHPKLAQELTQKALGLRRRFCHPLSIMRWHAESAALETAGKAGDTESAREHTRYVLNFLEMALGHVPWHPLLSSARWQAAELENELGQSSRAKVLMDLAVQALRITHGHEHPMTLRRERRRAELFGGEHFFDSCSVTLMEHMQSTEQPLRKLMVTEVIGDEKHAARVEEEPPLTEGELID